MCAGQVRPVPMASQGPPANLLDSLHDFYVRTYRNLIHVVQPRRPHSGAPAAKLTRQMTHALVS